MRLEIRLEEAADYRAVEELTREAFWNVHCPGCDEHYLVHILRDSQAFIPNLDYVAIIHEPAVTTPILAGNIMYTDGIIQPEQGPAIPVISFGPVSVLPQYQNMGIGQALIRHTQALARDMGHRIIAIYGDPLYYYRFGFEAAENYGVCGKDGYFSPALQLCALVPGALEGVSGRFIEDAIYELDPVAATEFDKSFAPKIKGSSLSQLRFQELISQSHK